MKKSWTEPKKKSPISSGARPSEKLVPVKKLENQVAQRDAKADERDRETQHRREAQRHFRMIGDAEHRHVIEPVEIVARDAVFARSG